MDWSCSIIPIDSSQSVCSCVYQEITGQTGFTGEHLDMLIVVVMPVGLLFLSLTLLTFVLCRGQLKVNNTAQVNLCISLLLAHLLFLFKGGFLKYISTNQLACAVLAGLLHFLFLSSFVWMFIDAVLLFISAKNLTKFRSKQKRMLGWKYLTVIGYVIPLLVVGVSVAAVPNGYSSEE
ncbi:adhesion G protein-coupled receptor E1-like [Colossoma macropomum]|uniref:adhesion G protein-coupled receptor E1-like n=1 Tax=Colossoma macropomum TaxID=42526 RepID=UPI0018648A10|nr:adhesion G protein-coupled receptor E1-like [Colossoma macropomum]